MDAQQALADLTEISSQIQAAVVFDENGSVAGSTLEDERRAADLARSANELLGRADPIRIGEAALTQLEVSTEDGSVFVVRDGAVRIAATTAPDPTVGLVFYDLKSVLRQLTAKPAAPKSRTPASNVATARKPDAAKKAPAAKKPPSAKKPPTAKKPAPARKRSAPRKKPDAP